MRGTFVRRTSRRRPTLDRVSDAAETHTLSDTFDPLANSSWPPNIIEGHLGGIPSQAAPAAARSGFFDFGAGDLEFELADRIEIEQLFVPQFRTACRGKVCLYQDTTKAIRSGPVTAGAVLPKQAIRALYQNTCVNHVTAVNPWPTFSWRRPGHEYRDIVVIAHKFVGETLVIKRLHAIIGVSTSGMNAMPWMIDGAAAIGKLKRVAESRFDRRPARR